MKANDNTQEIPLSEPEEDGDTQPEPDLGPWGAEAVQLGERSRARVSIDSNAHGSEKSPRRWIALAAVVCAAGVFSVFGALILSGRSATKEISSQTVPKTKRQHPVAEQMPNETRAAHRTRQRRRQAQGQASRRRPAAEPQTTRSTHSATYVPTPAPTPAPEPVAPSAPAAPALESPPTTKPPPASGPTVAKEFGFER